MHDMEEYVVLSLELHLFFARIMKEHSLFLKAGFTPVDSREAREAGFYKDEFEKVLSRAVSLGNGVVRQGVLDSGEVVTDFTLGAEKETERLTGIPIRQEITRMACRMHGEDDPVIRPELVRQVRALNQRALHLVKGLIGLKERVLHQVLHCRMFTVNYPLLLEHIIREAKLYCCFLTKAEQGMVLDQQMMKNVEAFWNQIMMEHALFIRGLLDPSQDELVETSDDFAQSYEELLSKAREQNDRSILRGESLKETIQFRDFKKAATTGILDCKIRSIILPLLADHVLREANHYIRLLQED